MSQRVNNFFTIYCDCAARVKRHGGSTLSQTRRVDPVPARRDKSLTSAWSTRADVSTRHFNYAHVYVYRVVWASVLHMPLRGVGGTVNQRRVRLQAASCASEMPCHLAPLGARP